MKEKQLRKRINKIREAMTFITTEINMIYNDNLEDESIPKSKQCPKCKGEGRYRNVLQFVISCEKCKGTGKQ